MNKLRLPDKARIMKARCNEFCIIKATVDKEQYQTEYIWNDTIVNTTLDTEQGETLQKYFKYKGVKCDVKTVEFINEKGENISATLSIYKTSEPLNALLWYTSPEGKRNFIIGVSKK